MSVLSHSLAPTRGPGAPPRTIAARLVLLVGLLLTALVATILPHGSAAEVASISNTNDTYYSQDGTCYVRTVAATGLSGADADRFITEMKGMIGKLGHHANFTFNNGTVTATATVDCPPGKGGGSGKEVFDNWIKPALAVVGGLALVISSSLAFTAVYSKITGHGPDPEGRMQKLMTSLGGTLSTALLSYIVGGGNWKSALSSAIAAFFTTYLVSTYNFRGLQDILKAWIKAAYGGAVAVAGAAGHPGRVLDALRNMREDFLIYLAQVRA